MKLSLSCIFYFLIFSSVNAQVDLQNTGTLYVTGVSDIFYINGNFTNTSAASLTNNGNLYIKGNLTNDQSSMSVGTGTLYLNGTSSQTVGGVQAFKTYNLNTDNTAGITLNSNLSVSGVHTFTNGLIASSVTPNYLIYEAGSSHTGSTDSRHVTGWVKKNGNTNFSFPVGDATYLRPAAVLTLSATSEINCHYYTPTSNVFSLTAPLVQVNANEYWQIDEISGGSGQVTLYWDNSKVPFDNVLVNDIRVGLYIGGSWRSGGGSAAGNVTTTGYVTSFIGSSFSAPMTFGYGSDVLLPLKLIRFTAERRTGTSYLHWVTDNEKGTDRFDIQRSYDGITFITIGHTAARNTSVREQYNYEDHSALQGIAYYRIKPVDTDGKFSYTKTVAVTENQFSNNSFLVLNPARSVITVFNKSGYDGLFDYRLFNAGGQLVLKGSVNMAINGSAVLPLPQQSAAGIYVLDLSNSRTRFLQKILVER
jgi:hypothetical protein